MIKKVIAMSCMEALQYVVFNRTNVEDFAIISIQEFETNGNGFKFVASGCCKDVLTMQFSDVNPELFYEQGMEEELKTLIETGKCKVFSGHEARQIKIFLKQIMKNESIETLIVHCSAGVSRSPAIAAAISKHLFGNDNEFWEKQLPNKYIYNLMLNDLEN